MKQYKLIKSVLILSLMLTVTQVTAKEVLYLGDVPNWYYDTAMGLSNGVAKTIAIIPNTPIDKAVNWTEKQAVDKNSHTFTASSTVGTITTGYVGGEVVGIFASSRLLAKTKALLKGKADKVELNNTKVELNNTKVELEKVIAKQKADDARRLEAARLRELEKQNTNNATNMGLTKPNPVDLTINED